MAVAQAAVEGPSKGQIVVIAIALLFVGVPLVRVITDRVAGVSAPPSEVVTGSPVPAPVARPAAPRIVRNVQSRYLTASQLEVWGSAKARDGSKVQVFLSGGRATEEVAILRLKRRRFHTLVRIPARMRGEKLKMAAFVTP